MILCRTQSELLLPCARSNIKYKMPIFQHFLLSYHPFDPRLWARFKPNGGNLLKDPLSTLLVEQQLYCSRRKNPLSCYQGSQLHSTHYYATCIQVKSNIRSKQCSVLRAWWMSGFIRYSTQKSSQVHQLFPNNFVMSVFQWSWHKLAVSRGAMIPEACLPRCKSFGQLLSTTTSARFKNVKGTSQVLKKEPRNPVLEFLPLAVVSGGQVQIRWAGLAWHWEYQIKRDSKCSKAVASKTCHFKQGRFRLIGQVWLGIEKTKPSKHA